MKYQLLLLLCLLGLLPMAAQEKEPEQLLTTDLWAGRTVADPAFVLAMLNARISNAPREGEKAPQFVLTDAKTGEQRALSKLCSKKPVVLFFGSRSCSITQGSSGAVKYLWEKFGNDADFYMIYIREAHPEGGFGSKNSGPERGDPEAKKFIAPDSQTKEERAAAALSYAKEKGIEFPILIDRMDDATTVRWGAWPVRLFFIDTSGTVIFAGQQGQWFHKPTKIYAQELEGVPLNLKDYPGYSRGSLEEFLEKRFLRKTEP